MIASTIPIIAPTLLSSSPPASVGTAPSAGDELTLVILVVLGETILVVVGSDVTITEVVDGAILLLLVTMTMLDVVMTMVEVLITMEVVTMVEVNIIEDDIVIPA